MGLADILRATTGRHGSRPALRLGDLLVSYDELDAACARMAGLLRAHGVGPGDRVAVMLPNVPHFAIAYYGALRLGAVVVPMNVLLKRREVRFLLADAGARVIVALAGFEEHAAAGAADAGATCLALPVAEVDAIAADATPVEDLATCADGDIALLLYTSGTTGAPKGAQLTHANLARNAEISAGLFALGPEDVTLGVLPLFHAFGQTCGMNTAARVGACLTLLPRFDPRQALDMLAHHDVSICLGVPTMYAAMLDHAGRADAPGRRLRVCISGGSAMPVPVLEACEATFGCPLLEGYGLSECSPVASFNQPGRERKPGSIGTPLEDVEMRLVDDDGRDLGVGEVGEILVRGHGVMTGYWNAPEVTARTLRDGWLHTGDLARVDEDGYYFIVDRKKDLIIRGGLNVYPREVEEVLLEHPDVRDAAVVAVPHPVLGEEVGAAVVLADGASGDWRALRAHVREQIAAYKYPRHVWFVDALPLGPTGKVLKRAISVPPDVLAAASARRSAGTTAGAA